MGKMVLKHETELVLFDNWGACGHPNPPAFPGGFAYGTARVLNPMDHETHRTWNMLIALVHACPTAIVHACTIAIVHACTIGIVHACTIAIVHACIIAIVHVCTIVVIHISWRMVLVFLAVDAGGPPRQAGGFWGTPASPTEKMRETTVPPCSIDFGI